jgi:multicomponent K+:H+ antiporter subunit D
MPRLAQSAALLLLVVFCVKAALLPLYFWLPDTYAAPPRRWRRCSRS